MICHHQCSQLKLSEQPAGPTCVVWSPWPVPDWDGQATQEWFPVLEEYYRSINLSPVWTI